MSQADVIECLKNSDKALSRTEIAEKTNISKMRASVNIRRLVELGEICAKEIDRRKALKIYGCKRRMCIYYLPKKNA